MVVMAAIVVRGLVKTRAATSGKRAPVTAATAAATAATAATAAATAA